MSEEVPSPDAPPSLPTSEHEAALALQEARRLEKIKAAHSSHITAGSKVQPDLPAVKRDEGE